MTSRRDGKLLGPGTPAGKYTVHYTLLPNRERDKPESIRVPMIAEVKAGDNDISISVPAK